METIKNYLESMFRNLPNTSEVIKAKNELLQMMEDKYTELRREGKSENEAVAKVIAEFGNLDEVAASLGIKEVIGEKKERERRNVSLEEVKDYIQDKTSSILLRVIGIALFIISCVPVIILDNYTTRDWLGVALIFVFVAIGIALTIVAKTRVEQWHFLKSEPCSISPATTDYVTSEKRKFEPAYTVMLCLGIALCVCCVIPAIIVDELPGINNDWGGALLFIFVAAGVGLMTYSSKRYNIYKKLLKLNSEDTIGGTYTGSKDKEPVYTNNTVRVIMSVYWQCITCIYLCVSFLTFSWGITWIIWPIAGIVKRMLDNIFTQAQ